MSNFPLLKLPALALHEVTKMMMPNDILKLVTCSSQLESFLNYRKYEIRGSHIHLKNGKPRLDVNHSDGIQIVRFDSTTRDSLESDQIGDRYCKEEDKCTYLTHINLESLQSVRIVPFKEWILYRDELSLGQFFELFFKILTTNFVKLTILAKRLSSEVLALVMDKLPTHKSLEIRAEIPPDFRHPNASEYIASRYTDARWMKQIDFISLRKIETVKLERTCFTCFDLNRFLQFWAYFDEFMLRKMEIKLKEGTVYDENVITDQIAVVSYYSEGNPIIFIKTKKEEGRKYVIGRLALYKAFAQFITLESHEHPVVYELLKLVTKQRELENEDRKIVRQLQMTSNDQANLLQERR